MKRILICEDEATIREFVVINLKRAGYDVVDVDCGEAALKTFEDEHGNFDIVLLDIMMPGIDGFTVCKKIREKKLYYRHYHAHSKNSGNGQGQRTYDRCR
jgi:DNA-binding response OmpR family regulator